MKEITHARVRSQVDSWLFSLFFLSDYFCLRIATSSRESPERTASKKPCDSEDAAERCDLVRISLTGNCAEAWKGQWIELEEYMCHVWIEHVGDDMAAENQKSRIREFSSSRATPGTWKGRGRKGMEGWDVGRKL